MLIWLCLGFVVVCGIEFPDQGLNPGPLHWECGVSHWTTREILDAESFSSYIYFAFMYMRENRVLFLQLIYTCVYKYIINL